jgi:hypothetical protein
MDATLWSIKSIEIQNHFLCFTYSDHRRITQLAQKHAGKLRIVERDQQAFWSLMPPSPPAYPAPPGRQGRPGLQGRPAIPGRPIALIEAEPSVSEVLAKLDLLAVLRAILHL